MSIRAAPPASSGSCWAFLSVSPFCLVALFTSLASVTSAIAVATCASIASIAQVSTEGPYCHGFRIPTSNPTGSVCRCRVSRFFRGPIWQRTPYGLYCDHIVVTKHCRVLTYFRTRPSRTVVTPLGSYSSCGRGVRSVCRADHRDPHPNSKVCPYETAIYGILAGS